jgi:hypothetical protein
MSLLLITSIYKYSYVYSLLSKLTVRAPHEMATMQMILLLKLISVDSENHLAEILATILEKNSQHMDLLAPGISQQVAMDLLYLTIK